MNHQRSRIGVALPAMLVALSACSGIARREAPSLTDHASAAPTGFPSAVMYVEDSHRGVDTQSPPLLQSATVDADSDPTNVLALSGGGAGVAFGAGALVGWSHTGTRPAFQIVTGVSAGALLAPFAFLGERWDGNVTEAFSGGRTQHLLQSRWSGALFGNSVYQGKPLVQLVDHYVTAELLRAIAQERAKGRLLLVATTDLDEQRTVIWDLGRIAAEGGQRGRELFRDVLVASASIPGIFPPVLIRVEDSGVQFDEMHVDGGTTASLFIAPEIAAVSPERIANLRGAKVFAIVNGQLHGNAFTTPVRTISIVKRGLSAALESSSRTAVEVTQALSIEVGMTLRVSEIPDSYPFGGALDMSPTEMSALYDFGFRCAIQRKLWGTAAQALVQGSGPTPVTAGVGGACPAASNRQAMVDEAIVSARPEAAAAVAIVDSGLSDGNANE